MRIGVIGGTFDPIHNMHVEIALAAKRTLLLDRVIFITAALPPHKDPSEHTHGLIRHKMVELAIASQDTFIASEIELQREGKSYTYDTIKQLRAQYESDELYYIIGGDSLAYIDTWYRAEELLKLCIFAVYPRGENNVEALTAQCDMLFEKYGADCRLISEIPTLADDIISISSTRIRELVKNGKDISKYVPEKVNEFIMKNNIYNGGKQCE